MANMCRKRVIVQCGIQIGNEYWFAAGNTNGLFKKNLSNDELSFVGFFLNEANTQFRAYTDVKLVDNKLVFTPCFAKRIAIYDLKKKKFSDVALPNYESAMNQYINSVHYKDFVYFIPFSSSFFIKINVIEGRLVNLDEWTDLKKQYLEQNDSNLIIENICTDGNNIFMFMSRRNQAIILDMDTDKFQVEELNIPSDECICSVCKADSRIWIATNRKKIYQWDYMNNEMLKIFDLGRYIINSDYAVHHINVVGKFIYLINIYDKNIRVFDYINNKFATINMRSYVKDKEDDDLSLYYYYDIRNIEDDKLSLFSLYDGKYITCKGESVSDSFDGFFLPEEYWEECFTDNFFQEGHMLNHISFYDEIEIMLAISSFVQAHEKYTERNIGSTIYNLLKE